VEDKQFFLCYCFHFLSEREEGAKVRAFQRGRGGDGGDALPRLPLLLRKEKGG